MMTKLTKPNLGNVTQKWVRLLMPFTADYAAVFGSYASGIFVSHGNESDVKVFVLRCKSMRGVKS